MGEHQGNLFEPQFNRSVKVQSTDHRITSNAGVILLREAEHRLGLFDAIAKNIHDPRRPDRIRYSVDELIRERVFAMAIGCSAQDDIDSFPIEVHGKHHGAEYNGYYKKTVYHPLVASLSIGGDYDSTHDGHRLGNGFIHATLRQGQVQTADGMQRFLDKTDAKARQIGQHVDYRLDAGYTIGSVMDALSSKNRRFVGRLKTNTKLDALAAEHIVRPAGRPPAGGYEYTAELGSYQVDTWEHPQRLILVVVDQPDSKTGQLNLIPRWFFLVTNWSEDSRSAPELLAHYRKRGKFEDRLGEFNESVGVHLSSQGFKANEATMPLALLAFNLNTICRNELEDSVGGCWDMQRFILFVLKVGGEMIKHSRRLVLRIAESAEPLWSHLVGRVERWKVTQLAVSKPQGFTPPPSHSHRSEVLRYYQHPSSRITNW